MRVPRWMPKKLDAETPLESSKVMAAVAIQSCRPGISAKVHAATPAPRKPAMKVYPDSLLEPLQTDAAADVQSRRPEVPTDVHAKARLRVPSWMPTKLPAETPLGISRAAAAGYARRRQPQVPLVVLEALVETDVKALVGVHVKSLVEG